MLDEYLNKNSVFLLTNDPEMPLDRFEKYSVKLNIKISSIRPLPSLDMKDLVFI